jgi:U3 small nucleolar ribonucleoprotein protein LCP5
MAGDAGSSLLTLLSSMTAALESATQTVPEQANAPHNGLSLLNTKNELFLCYLENLVFLILIKLQHYTNGKDRGEKSTDLSMLHRTVVEKLAELRLYLDKGVRPLEGRLKFQIERVVRASEEVSKPQQSARPSPGNRGTRVNGKASKLRRHSGSSVSSSASVVSDSNLSDSDTSENANDLAFRARRSAIVTPNSTQPSKSEQERQNSGVYRPPKITPTALHINVAEKASRSRDKPIKSAAIDDYIANEMSTAPMAEPSVGSIIRSGGRATLTTREREKLSGRTRYEEENFVRLPGLSKKERKAKGGKKESFGGEEWGNLNASVDRIGRLVGRRNDGSNALERSRKRTAMGQGVEAASRFEKRRKHN